MARIDSRVTITERITEMVPGGRAGIHNRLTTSYRERGDMGFLVQGNVPSQCRRAAKEEAQRRYGHTHYILSVNIAAAGRPGEAISVLVEPRGLPVDRGGPPPGAMVKSRR